MYVRVKRKLIFTNHCLFFYTIYIHNTSSNQSRVYFRRHTNLCMSASFSPVSVVKLLTILAISRPLFSKHTIIAAVVSAESTDYTMQLSAIKSPRRAVAVHVAFEIGSGRSSERVEILLSATVLHAYAYPMTTGSAGGIGIDHEKVRFVRQVDCSEYAVKVSDKSQCTLDLFRVHTPKSNTTFLSRSISITFSNSA